MKAFLLALLAATAVSSALTLLLLTFAPALLKRYSARAVSAAFLIALLSFLMIGRLPSRPPALTVSVPRAAVVAVSSGTSAALAPDASRRQAESAPSRAQADETLDTYEMLFIVWACGALAVALRETLRHRRFTRLIRRWSREAPPCYQEALRSAAREMNVPAPGIFVCPVTDGPMLTGLAHLRVLIPEDGLTREELLPILRHELTHARRRDLWRRLLSLPILALHWFNPIVWLAARGQAFYAELACDEAATAGQTLMARRGYAEAILCSIRRGRARTALSTGFIGGKKQMKKRIETVLSPRQKRVGTALVCLTLAAALLLSGALALSEAPAASVAEKARIQYTQEYGEFFDWPAEVKGAYTEFCVAEGKLPEDGLTYARPADGDLSLRNALDKVCVEIGADGIENYFRIGLGFVADGGARYWLIKLKPIVSGERDYSCTFKVESPTGRIISAVIPDGAVNGALWAFEDARNAQTKKYDELSARYGTDMGLWPLAAKAEYAQVSGELAGSENRLISAAPDESDLPENKARAAADAEFDRVCGESDDDYSIRVIVNFYGNWSPDNPRVYVFDYSARAKGEMGGTFSIGTVSLASPSGEILESDLHLRENQAAYELTRSAQQAFNQKTARDGMWVMWPFEDIDTYKEFTGLGQYTLSAQARAGQISRDEAIRIARQHIADHCATLYPQAYYKTGAPVQLTKERIDEFKVCALLCSNGSLADEKPFWDVFLFEDEWLSIGLLDTYDMHIDAQTGEVLLLFEPGGNG